MGALGCRAWAEYIPSPDKIADPLSRDGLEDTLVATKIATGVWRSLSPSVEVGRSLGLEDFGELWAQFTLHEKRCVRVPADTFHPTILARIKVSS